MSKLSVHSHLSTTEKCSDPRQVLYGFPALSGIRRSNALSYPCAGPGSDVFARQGLATLDPHRVRLCRCDALSGEARVRGLGTV
jgi:hypothetical protein